MMKKTRVFCFVGLLTVGFFTGLGSAGNVPVAKNVSPAPSLKEFTTHAPIRINNDTDFDKQFSNRTIWGLEINGNSYGFCIFIGNCSQPFTVKNCYLHDASGRYGDPFFNNTGLYMYNSANGTLFSNTASSNFYGISLDSSNNNSIYNNNASGNTKFGIILYDSSNNIITNNTANANNNGIDLFNSNKNTLIENNCSLNFHGIYLFFSNNSTITNNTCSVNFDFGIFLSSDSNRNTLSYNNCSSNYFYGIYLEYSSRYNRINHNNFINNNGGGKQANDSVGTNFWNTSTEGNYWSDWTGPDVNPPYGIVDSPYEIDGGAGAKDYYPLTTPVVVTEFSPTALIIMSIILITMIGIGWKRGKRKKYS